MIRYDHYDRQPLNPAFRFWLAELDEIFVKSCFATSFHSLPVPRLFPLKIP